jgi:hypothetical protein
MIFGVAITAILGNGADERPRWASNQLFRTGSQLPVLADAAVRTLDVE